MALRSLLRKVPALGLRSPAGPLMGPVHAPSPAAYSRHMSSHARTLPKDKLLELDPYNKLVELDQLLAENSEATRTFRSTILRDGAKWDKRMNAVLYSFETYVAFHVLRHIFKEYSLC